MTMTAEQNALIAGAWNDPNLSIDEKKRQMETYGVGVTDVMNATGQDLNAVASAFKGGGDWGGLHFNPNGTLYGTDWAGPVSQAVAQPDPFAMVGGSAPSPAPVASVPTSSNMTPEQNKAIAAFWAANKGDPKAVMAGMTQYGVSAQDLANAIGRNVSEVGNYLVDAGAARGFGGFNKGITDTYYGSAANPSQYELAQIAAAKNPTVVAGPVAPGKTALDGLRDPNLGPFTMGGGQPPTPAGAYQPSANVVQPGTSPGWMTGNTGGPAQPYPQQQQASQYQMPVLNALYQAQQQRMAAPVPRFNFQQQGPLTATAAANPQQSTIMAGETPPGALTTAISGT